MKLSKLKIQNFRGIRDLELDLDDVTVLVGENNTGKTAVLDALRLCLRELGPRRGPVFETFDFHLASADATPAAADPIEIQLTFSESRPEEWEAPLVAHLNRSRILQMDDGGRGHVRFRLRCWYDPAERDLRQEWSFLNLEGLPLTGLAESALASLQREVPCYYLAALRDAARQFDARGPFWRPFLRDSQLPTERREEIEAALKEVNDLVVGSHESFERVCEQLRAVQEIVPLATGDAVSIEAVPGRMFDMLSKAQVHLGTTTGAKIPVARHGEGTQSLAVLMLFSAFLTAWRSGSPIVALEEPEAHLHPSAVRALWNTVRSLGNQTVVSTHSGDLLSEVPPNAIRRLSRTPDGIRSFRLMPGTITPEQEWKLDFFIRRSRGELLFARCWLLFEGESEATLLPELARILGINLAQAGVRCIPHRVAGIELFLKVARDLGIRWCVLTDNDDQGTADQRHVTDYTAPGDLADVLHPLPEKDIETHLCGCGFGPIYESYLSRQTRQRVTATPGDVEYWPQVLKAIKYSKPAAAMRVAQEIERGRAPAPPLLERALRKAVKIAEGP